MVYLRSNPLYQLAMALVLSFLLTSSIPILFDTAYAVSARSMEEQAVKSVALYLPPSTLSAKLQYVPRTGNSQTDCLKDNVKPENWHTTYTFHVSLASGSQITVTPSSSNDCGGSQSQTFNIPLQPTSSECRLNVENGEIGGCTGEKLMSTVKSIRLYPPPGTNSIQVTYSMVDNNSPFTKCLKNTVSGTWTPGENATTAHRSFSPGSPIKVNTYSSTDCSGQTLQANLSFTVPNIGQTYNSTCWLDIGQNKMTGCNTGN
jgi:hypothetical protein